MASPERPARERHAAYNLVAVYPTVEQARQAAAALDAAGIDAAHVELIDRNTPSAASNAVAGQVGRRAAIGAVIGGVVGVLVGVVIHLIATDNIVPEIVGAIVGLIVGIGLGAFYGGATGLPRDGSFSTVRARHNAVAVHADEAEIVERAVATLKPTSPEQFARFGADGELHPL